MRVLWQTTGRAGFTPGRVGIHTQMVRLKTEPTPELLETVAGLFNPHEETGPLRNLDTVLKAAISILS